METIKEDYVSFEVAKLLKEKGFDEYCLMCYTSDGKLGNYGHYRSYKNSDVFSLTAPTLQMAMRWLREVHNLFIGIELGVNAYVWTITNTTDYVTDYVDATVGTYEEAVEATIKYCLKNLI